MVYPLNDTMLHIKYISIKNQKKRKETDRHGLKGKIGKEVYLRNCSQGLI